VKTVESLSWYVNIWIAGDYAQAVQTCRAWSMEVGGCVAVTPAAYVYTGGTEDGVLVRFLNYPRFPKPLGEILEQAKSLAERLRISLCQWSYTIETPERTLWFSNRPEDNK